MNTHADDTLPRLELEETMERLGNDRVLLRELYNAFRQDAPLRLDELAQALEGGDMETAARRAHTLKGSSSAIGALRGRDLAIRLEAAVKESDIDASNELLHALKAEMKGILADMDATPN